MSKKRNKRKKEQLNLKFTQIPGFSRQFKEDLKWWFKTDAKKASKILDLVTEVMKDMDTNIWSRL